MEAKIKQEFRDKYTNVLYKEGEVVEFAKERIDEIKATGPYVEVVKEAKKETKEE